MTISHYMFTYYTQHAGIWTNSDLLHRHINLFPHLETLMPLWQMSERYNTVYTKKYAHGFLVLCFVVVMQSFILNSHQVFIHIHQGCFAGTGAIVRLPQCQWNKPDRYRKTSQCITTTKHSTAKTVCIFLGIYCTLISGLGSFARSYIYAFVNGVPAEIHGCITWLLGRRRSVTVFYII